MIDYENLLNINTEGIDDSIEDFHHNRYESTPYLVLERLIQSNYINENDHVLDYGCGKGRVSIFLDYYIHCKVTGIDYNKNLIKAAKGNRNLHFECMKAEEYKINTENCFYFFNPFSLSILKKVIHNIIISYYENPRNIRLFFYYPELDTLSYLMGLDLLLCIDEIDCRDLFDGNDEREYIFVFEIEKM